MSDDAARRALAELARSGGGAGDTASRPAPKSRDSSFRETIERATAAVEQLDAAADFVETVGLDELERAVERADQSVSGCTQEGRRALASFRDVRNAANGEPSQSGHRTSLGRGDLGPSK